MRVKQKNNYKYNTTLVYRVHCNDYKVDINKHIDWIKKELDKTIYGKYEIQDIEHNNTEYVLNKTDEDKSKIKNEIVEYYTITVGFQYTSDRDLTSYKEKISIDYDESKGRVDNLFNELVFELQRSLKRIETTFDTVFEYSAEEKTK